MKCENVKELIPEIRRFPGKYPEAEAHIAVCDDCRRELDMIRQIFSSDSNTRVDGEPEKVKSAVRMIPVRRAAVWTAAASVILVMTAGLISSLRFTSATDNYFAVMEMETLQVLNEIDESAGVRISEDEIIEYLIDHDTYDNMGYLESRGDQNEEE